MHTKQERSLAGQAWLRRELKLAVPPPAVESYIAPGPRRSEADGSRTAELYPKAYAPSGSVVSHLRFMLRHEAFDIGVLVAALKAVEPAILEGWVRNQPTGAFSRRAWFFYETLTGRTLDVPDAGSGNYVNALNPRLHIPAGRRNSRRHRVIDNLLGNADLCVTVRRTAALAGWLDVRTDEEARALCEAHDPVILHRALNYLYTRETRSTFAIEGEAPTARREARFIAALKVASEFDPLDKADLLRLQGSIVDPRYAARNWRRIQNFVGRTTAGFGEAVDYICPRPDDVPRLMEGWMALTRRVAEEPLPPVVAAAIVAFAFVFIHPFEDGNGRVHRFLIHHILAKRGYGPPEIILPVSAAILRDRAGYDRVLETFSRPLGEYIEWRWTPEREVHVENDTLDLYRYADLTVFAEYLHERLAETVHRDLGEELGFLAVFDRATRAVRRIVDMPDRRLSLLVRLCMQNDGRFPKRRRGQFPELTDGEIAAIQQAVRDALASQA